MGFTAYRSSSLVEVGKDVVFVECGLARRVLARSKNRSSSSEMGRLIGVHWEKVDFGVVGFSPCSFACDDQSMASQWGNLAGDGLS